MADIPYNAGVQLRGDLDRLLTAGQAAAAGAKTSATSATAARDLAIQANIDAESHKDGAAASAAAAASSASDAAATAASIAGITVNGHAGPTIDLSAHDVGAYTRAEVDQALAAAAAAAFVRSLIFG